MLLFCAGNALNKTAEVNAMLRYDCAQGTRPCSALRLAPCILHQFYFSQHL